MPIGYIQLHTNLTFSLFSKYRKSVHIQWGGVASAVCLEEVPYNDPQFSVHYKVGVGEDKLKAEPRFKVP